MQDRIVTMTPDQIALVQMSFDKVAPISATAGVLFYRRLFELNPGLRPLFTSDLQIQSRKLMAMIELIVDNLSRFETLGPQVEALGRAHVGYGARDADYDTIGSALLWALQLSLEEQFTPAVEVAWSLAYGLIAATMRSAARGAVSLNP